MGPLKKWNLIYIFDLYNGPKIINLKKINENSGSQVKIYNDLGPLKKWNLLYKFDFYNEPNHTNLFK